MSSMNPEIYYENEENHGSYIYLTIEELVNNFMSNYVGDETILGPAKRSKVVYQIKQGIKEFNVSALREVKSVELELNDTLDIILPPDYLQYVRISYVNPYTGECMVLSINEKMPLATSYLQDNQANILFDDDGFILEGDTLLSEINDNPAKNTGLRTFIGGCNGYCSAANETFWGLDTSQNFNGTFNIDTRKGKIHFSSDNLTRVLLLEYISDGLEYSSESDIKINKLAEIALYNWVHWNLLSTKLGVQEYIIRRAEKNYTASFRNSKIKLMNIKATDVAHFISGRKQWIKA